MTTASFVYILGASSLDKNKKSEGEKQETGRVRNILMLFSLSVVFVLHHVVASGRIHLLPLPGPFASFHSLTSAKLLRLMHKDFSSSNGIFYQIASVRFSTSTGREKKPRKAESEDEEKSFSLRSLSCSKTRANITFFLVLASCNSALSVTSCSLSFASPHLPPCLTCSAKAVVAKCNFNIKLLPCLNTEKG